MEIVFLFVFEYRLFCKAKCTITAKQQFCRFLVPELNIQNVAAGLTRFTVVEIKRFTG